MFCFKCGKPNAEGAIFCESCGQKLKVATTIDVESATLAGVWTRYAARWMDCNLEIFFAVIFFYVLGVFEDQCGDVIIAFVFLPFALLLDGIVYSIFGNTLGKWLFGVKVVELSGESISRTRYFFRNLCVYWAGYGLGLPIVSLITHIHQYNLVSKRKPTTYDNTLKLMSIRYNASGVKTFFGVLVLVVEFTLLLLSFLA